MAVLIVALEFDFPDAFAVGEIIDILAEVGEHLFVIGIQRMEPAVTDFARPVCGLFESLLAFVEGEAAHFQIDAGEDALDGRFRDAARSVELVGRPDLSYDVLHFGCDEVENLRGRSRGHLKRFHVGVAGRFEA